MIVNLLKANQWAIYVIYKVIYKHGLGVELESIAVTQLYTQRGIKLSISGLQLSGNNQSAVISSSLWK